MLCGSCAKNAFGLAVDHDISVEEMRAILLLGVLVVVRPAARGTPRAQICEELVKAVDNAVRPEWGIRQACTVYAFTIHGIYLPQTIHE